MVINHSYKARAVQLRVRLCSANAIILGFIIVIIRRGTNAEGTMLKAVHPYQIFINLIML